MKHFQNLLQALIIGFLFSGGSLAWSQVTVSGSQIESVQPPIEYSLKDVEIGLERTVCFGTCPSYTLRIFGDGRVIYEGRQFVRVTGTREYTIDKSNVLNILRQLYVVDFFNMPDLYMGPIMIGEKNGIISTGHTRSTDLPTLTVRVRIGQYEKQARHEYWGTSDLLNLMELIDRESGAEQWIK
ncbi:MAG: DUF6438 domain-containing protein [Pseudomonadota bacterium]